jgi:hypothetical protein
MGAGDWDFTTGSKPLTPGKDERLIFAISAMAIYLAIIGVYCLAKTKFPYLFNIICALLVVNLVQYQYFYMPFSPKSPREFMFWSIMLLFRSCLVVVAFQFNGAYDLIFALFSSIAIIGVRVMELTAPENIVWLIAPVLSAFVGLSIFSYMIAKE